MLQTQCGAVRIHITHYRLSSGPKCDVTFMSSRDNRRAERDYGCFDSSRWHKALSPALFLSPPPLFLPGLYLLPSHQPPLHPYPKCVVYMSNNVASVICWTKGPQIDSPQTIASELPWGLPDRGGRITASVPGERTPQMGPRPSWRPLAYCECWKVRPGLWWELRIVILSN